MSRLIMPILLFIAAIGLFLVYTNPTYQDPSTGIKGLSAQNKDFADALSKATELKKERDRLLSKRNTFTDENLARLKAMLPDNVDNIRLIIDINNVATRHGLSLKNVQLGSVSDGTSQRSASAVGSSGSPVGSVELGFTVTASYEDFLAFVRDLEHSLRVLDIEKISFKAGENATSDYLVTVRTYWLH